MVSVSRGGPPPLWAPHGALHNLRKPGARQGGPWPALVPQSGLRDLQTNVSGEENRRRFPSGDVYSN